MSYRRKHFARSSPLRSRTILVPIYKPGEAGGKVHANMSLDDGAGYYNGVGTELITTAKVSPGCGVLLTTAAIESDEGVTLTLTGIDQFGDFVQEDTAVLDDSPTTWESTYAYAQVQSLKIKSLTKATADGSAVVKIGYSGAATHVLGIPAKLGAASELLGVMCSKHSHTRDENCDAINLTIENVNVTKHTFTLATGTGFGSATIGGENQDMILWCSLLPDSPSL